MEKIRVIIATNSVFMYAMVRRLLKEENVEVLKYVKSGYAALKYYLEFKPDLMLVGMELEDIDGIEAIKTIIEQDPDAKIVMLSEKKDIDTVVKAIKAGAKQFIAFPISRSELMAKLQEVLAE